MALFLKAFYPVATPFYRLGGIAPVMVLTSPRAILIKLVFAVSMNQQYRGLDVVNRERVPRQNFSTLNEYFDV